MTHQDVVLVAGPAFSGVTSVLNALRAAVPGCTFVESHEGAGRLPLALVFVTSASAVLVRSDCDILGRAAVGTGSVVVAVSKIDVHRNWRAVLDADRSVLAEYDPTYREARWVGVAAEPDLGAPELEALVDAVKAVLADPALRKRSELRSVEAGLLARAAQLDDGVTRPVKDAEDLRRRRAQLARANRRAASERVMTSRNRIHEVRLLLGAYLRRCCQSARIELVQQAASMTRRRMGSFPGIVRHHLQRAVDDIDDEVIRQLGFSSGLAADPVEIEPPPAPRRLEGRLVALLGVAFGLGVALSVGRLLVQLDSGSDAVVVAMSGLVGIAVTVWVVGVRSLLQHRLALERWVGEAVSTMRAHAEDRLAVVLLSAERDMMVRAAQCDAAECQRLDDVVAEIDRDIRKLVSRSARASAERDRLLVAVESDLRLVRAEFGRI